MGKYRPEKTPYLNTFHAVLLFKIYQNELFFFLRDIDFNFADDTITDICDNESWINME